MDKPTAAVVPLVDSAMLRLRLAEDEGGVGFVERNLGSNRVEMNTQARAIYGFGLDEEVTADKISACIHAEEIDSSAEGVDRVTRGTTRVFAYEGRISRADTGEVRFARRTMRVVQNAAAERVLLETIVEYTPLGALVGGHGPVDGGLRHQRLDLLGQLSAGVAHDMNNSLFVMAACTAMLRDRFGDDAEATEDFEALTSAIESASWLSRRLLAFGRRDPADPSVIDLSPAIRESLMLCERLVGAGIDVTFEGPAEALHVKCDRGHIEQILVNLCANARDAMPEGGRIDIVLTSHGDSATLSVTDVGAGMNERTLARVFEPFFSTKDGGSGLGLSTVHDIVGSIGGTITADSTEFAGTTFTIRFPLTTEGPSPGEDERAAVGGPETVLLVDDNPAVKTILRRMLQRRGYHVVAVSGVAEALRAADAPGRPIGLLLSDVMLVDGDGPTLFQTLLERRPDLRVIYMSGYSAAHLAEQGVQLRRSILVEKPFDFSGLLSIVRRVLDA